MAEKSEHQYLDEVLPGFWEARVLIKSNGDSVKPLGFLGDKFEFYRFANRYRMAVRFTGIQLEGFGENTERGYSALTRTFFAWSVFERYTGLDGIRDSISNFLLSGIREDFARRLKLAKASGHA